MKKHLQRITILLLVMAVLAWTAPFEALPVYSAAASAETKTAEGVAASANETTAEDAEAADAAVKTAQHGKGSVTIDKPAAVQGDTVKASLAPAKGYYLAQLCLVYKENGKSKYAVQKIATGAAVQEEAQTVSFVMPAEQVTVRADFVPVVWDGTIDLTWYDAGQDSYALAYPAQLAGAAALVNGLFNDMPVRAVQDGSATVKIPDLVDAEGSAVGLADTADGYVKDDDHSGYQTFADVDGDGRDTSIVGDIGLLKIGHASDEVGGNNKVTTNTYWYGNVDFTGKTIRLTRDMDMGGELAGGAKKTVCSAWSGPNYMPIGGQYSMDRTNGYTRLTAGFNGSFDGQGHMVYNLYISRHTDTFGNCQAVGLFGLVGVNRVESGTVGTPVIENVAVDGMVYGNRSIGGIVGKTVHAKGVKIRNCMNFATVYNTDAKGCGGIVGAAWYEPAYGDKQVQIENCANFGFICTGYNKNAGGLVGSSEAFVADSYSIGYTAGEGSGNSRAGQALGTNNGGAVWYNCYALQGASSCTQSSSGSYMPYVYGSTVGSAIRVLDAPSAFASGKGMKALLNGKVKSGGTDKYGYMDSDSAVIKNTKRAWVEDGSSDTQERISSHLAEALQSVASWHDPAVTLSDEAMRSQESIADSLSAVDATGFPIPRTFIHDKSSLCGITYTGTPTKQYLSGETFDTGDQENLSTSPNDSDSAAAFSVWATFDDDGDGEVDSWTELTDYEVCYEHGSEFTAGDTKVTVRGTCLGTSYEKEITGLQVTACQLLSLEITADPTNTLYASGETFCPDGMTITTEYGTVNGSDKTTAVTVKASYAEGKVSYTKIRESAPDVKIELGEEAAKPYACSFSPSISEKLTKATSKVTVSLTYNGTTLSAKIPVTVLSSSAPRLVKDGASDTQTVYLKSADDFLWFANQVTTNAAADMNAVQEEDIDLSEVLTQPVGLRSKESAAYEGIYDGQGHSLTLNMRRSSDTAGLFYSVAGMVKNLTLRGSVQGGSHTGAAAGQLDGGTISNCTAENVSVSGSKQVGGLVGQILGEDAIISDCTVSGDITGSAMVGGLAGEADDLTAKITGCQVGDHTTVTASALDGGGVGGLIGVSGKLRASGNAGAAISRCRSEAKVSGTAAGGKSGYVGGLIGLLRSGELEQSANKGEVASKGENLVGGIAGQAAANAVIRAAYSNGSLSLAEAGYSAMAGGIAGAAASGTVVKNCYASGAVSADEAESAAGKPAVGAAFGSIHDKSILENNVALQGSAPQLIGSAAAVSEAQAVLLSKEDLQGDAALTRLNAEDEQAYQTTCDSWPIFRWETPTHTAGAETKENVTAATHAKAGGYDLVVRCKKCHKVISSRHIVEIPLSLCTISGIADKIYTGKDITQAVAVRFAGTKVTVGVSYPDGRRTIGTHTVTITGTGSCTGTIRKTYRILPAKVTSLTAKAGKRSFATRWKKGAGGVHYQIAYRRQGRKAWTVKTATANAKTVTKLKTKQRYQVRVRAYRKVGGRNYCGAWSSAVKVKVK